MLKDLTVLTLQPVSLRVGWGAVHATASFSNSELYLHCQAWGRSVNTLTRALFPLL